MAQAATADWERSLAAWLAPFLEALGHKVRQRWAPVHVRGLLGPGERKSVQPMAARVAPADCGQSRHFISSPAWRTAPLAAVLAREADRLVGGPEAAPIIDDTALPKKGVHSAGVARQYAGAPGRTANCQALVSLTLARGEVPVPPALRLYLPQAWRCGSTCPRPGAGTGGVAPRRGCRRAAAPSAARGRSRSTSSTGSMRPGSASAAPWRTPATAAAPPSGAASPPAPRSGRSASRRRRRSTPPR